MKLEEVLREVKRFIYDEIKADYGSARPIEAVLDEKAAKWKVTCEYEYKPYIFATSTTKIVELEVDDISGKIESFKQVK